MPQKHIFFENTSKELFNTSNRAEIPSEAVEIEKFEKSMIFADFRPKLPPSQGAFLDPAGRPRSTEAAESELGRPRHNRHGHHPAQRCHWDSWVLGGCIAEVRGLYGGRRERKNGNYPKLQLFICSKKNKTILCSFRNRVNHNIRSWISRNNNVSGSGAHPRPRESP